MARLAAKQQTGVPPLVCYITPHGPSMAIYLMRHGPFWPAWYFQMRKPLCVDYGHPQFIAISHTQTPNLDRSGRSHDLSSPISAKVDSSPTVYNPQGKRQQQRIS